MELRIFEKAEFGSVRVVMKGGEPWFVAKDVCNVLELENVGQALTCLDDDEKTSIAPNIITADVGFDAMMQKAHLPMHAVIPEAGRGGRPLSLISEPGLYSLILRSRKPEAKAFKRWITHEVIPSIRKTGAYATNNALTMPNFSNPAEAARAWADEYEAKQRSALILLKRMSKPPFLDRSGGFALSSGCTASLTAFSRGGFTHSREPQLTRRQYHVTVECQAF